VDVRETPADFERFAAAAIGPITAKHGIGKPRITGFPVHEIRRGDPAPVTFMHLVRLRGLDAAGFAELDQRIGPQTPDGLVFHANGASEDGWAAVGFWTSKDARDRFVEEQLRPILAELGERPSVEDLDLHNSLTEAAVGSNV
jgi:hypothetical protein